MRAIPIVIAACLAASGCASYPASKFFDAKSAPVSGEHPLEPSRQRQFLSCDYETWWVRGNGNTHGAPEALQRSGASSMHALPAAQRELADRSFIYAIHANNVYRDNGSKPIYVLPEWNLVERRSYATGLEYERLHRIEGGEVTEIVIAFKGTDTWSLLDWMANLSIWKEPRQYAQAQQYVELVLAESDFRNVPVIVTGHSLGGGIALNVGLRQSTPERPIDAYAFNPSPRAFYAPIHPEVPAAREVLYERGEILRIAQLPWSRKLGRMTSRHAYNYRRTPYRVMAPGAEHAIYELSRGLLLTAVNQGSGDARRVFQDNVPLEQVEAVFPLRAGASKDLAHDRAYCDRLLASESVGT